MDMTWILQHQVFLLATCHIHVLSMSYPFFQKRYIWIYLGYPRLKNLHLVYTRYIFSCHMPYLSMSYPCHKFVRLSCSGQQMKFSRKSHCGSSLAYHSTAFIKHNRIYLPPPARRARGLLLCPLPWVGTPLARAPARPPTPAGAGAACAGAAGAGAGSSGGSAGGGAAGVWGFLGV